MSIGRILVIAGSDSSGGAGLEADQKTIAAHQCYAMTATTALTAQNTQGVVDINITPPEFVKKQIEACLLDIGVDVIKTGMLASSETVQVVAGAVRDHRIPLVVVDPRCPRSLIVSLTLTKHYPAREQYKLTIAKKMVATTGARLLPQDAVRNLREQLLPLTTVLTPNIPEAQLLLKDAGQGEISIQSIEDLKAIAKKVQELGPRNVLLKGGHSPLGKSQQDVSKGSAKSTVANVLYGEGEYFVLETDFIDSKGTHGTGCSLASAIASGLARGKDIKTSVKAASRYVETGIKTAPGLGNGNGPINHFHSSYILPFSDGHFLDYLLDHEDVTASWKEHTEHDFVAGIAADTLPLESFKYYLIQDYLFLIQFARANALAAYKAKNMKDISLSASIVQQIQTEMALHLEYCAEFGLSKEDIEDHEEDQACTAYTRYVLEIGQSEDWLALQVALAPCLIGYGVIARRLYDDPDTKREGNRYWKWIQTYVDEDYVEAVRIGRDNMERHAIRQSPSRIEELVKIFLHATKMETGFWDMGWSIGGRSTTS